jgi:hypothetical protein
MIGAVKPKNVINEMLKPPIAIRFPLLRLP